MTEYVTLSNQSIKRIGSLETLDAKKKTEERLKQSSIFLRKYQVAGLVCAVVLAVLAAGHGRFFPPGGDGGDHGGVSGEATADGAAARVGLSERQGFFAQSWWLPGAAVVDRAPRAPKKKIAPKRRRWGRAPRAADSRAVSALKASETLLRKARGRTAKWPVHALPFMDAVRALMPAFEVFGSSIHAAATKDVLGNVEKLRRNGAPATPIHKAILDDIATKNSGHPDSTTQAFVWLKRILRFTAAFFDNLVQRRDLELNDCLVKAYEVHLGPHHNAIMRQIAIVLMQIIPDRRSMMQCFELDDFDLLAPHLTRWNDAALPLVAKIDQFYTANGLKV